MGFFDFITGAIGSVAHAIDPDIDPSPSGLLKEAGKLLPSLAEAIPGVGPLVSKGISAVESIFGKSSKDDSKATEAKAAFPDLSEVKSLISDTTAAINKNKTVIMDRLNQLDEHLTSDLQTLEDKEERRLLHKQLKDDSDKYHDKVSPSISWMKNNIVGLHGFISYADNPDIKKWLGTSGGDTTELQVHCTALRDAVTEIEGYMETNMPPTQEILDLYVLAVNWLLVYDKTILTLRSYLAHSYFTVDPDLHTQDYLDARADYSLDLDQAISDAQTRGDFLVKTVDEIRFQRLDQIWHTWEEGAHDDTDRKLRLFYDKYPTYGVGVAQSDLTNWNTTHKCLWVYEYINTDSDKAAIKKKVDALHQAYKGLQASCVRASTAPHREHALSWQISADRWRRSKPLRPAAGKSPVDITFVASEANDKKAAGERGLSPQDAIQGKGYEVGDRLRYAVSYVTNHGEGMTSEFGVQWTQKGQPHSGEFVVPTGLDKAFFCLKLHPIDFNISSDEDLAKKADAKQSDEDQSAHIVRRLYVWKITKDGVKDKRHVIDIYAPPHKAVFVWDLDGSTSLPTAKHASKLETYEKGEFNVD